MGNSYYNGTSIPLYTLVSYGNPYLKGEKKSEFDAGLDFSILKSRLSGSFDFYTNTSTSLLYQYNIPSPGYYYYNWVWLNPGIIRGSGLELTLNYNVIKKTDFSYSITLTRSHNLKNTLVSLSENYNGTELKYGINDIGYLGSPGGCCAVLGRSEEGKPIGQLIAFVDKGIDENGRFILADQNGDGQINSLDWAVVGNGLPEYLTGLGNEFTYKNWDLNIFFRSVSGHDLVNSYRAIYEVPNYITAYNVPKTTANMRNAANGKFLSNTGGILTSIDI
jgi:iron complex outermembrane receptor protein